jgi:seryl-tRNA synthetase
MKNKNNFSIKVEELSKLKNDLENIYKTLYRGNGTPALVTQVVKLEEQIKSLDEKLENKFDHITEVVTEKFNHLADQIHKEFNSKDVILKNKWGFRTTLSTSIISSATAILVVILTHFIKNFQ